MFKKFLCAVLLAAMTVPAFAAADSAPAMDKKVASSLIDEIGEMFHQMAAKGTGGAEMIDKGIQQFMADAKKARDAKQINAIFYRRYAYVLAIIKMTAAPDPGGILTPIIDRELGQFVGNVLGEEWKGTGSAAIGQVANAIITELIDLQMYVDNLEKREKLRKAWDEKLSAVPKKEPGEAPVR
jgi:hypothetical protein